jgi:hypothetical protein
MLTRWAITCLVPAAVAALYYVVLGGRTNDSFTFLFACLAFAATLCGTFGAVVFARRNVRRMSLSSILAATAATAIILLAAIRTVPSWPFADIGLIVAWALVSGAVAWLCITLSAVGMPNKSLERTRER